MVQTRQQSRLAEAATLESPNSLANLPAEIIHEIARHLDKRHNFELSLNDVETRNAVLDLSDCATVISVDSDDEQEDKDPGCTLTCCRSGPMHEGAADHGTNLRICVRDSLNFSACSRRLRQIIFIDGRRRARNIRYCDWWRKETLAMPEVVRKQYK